jgi:DNA-binding XRE family transcriptional regulator
MQELRWTDGQRSEFALRMRAARQHAGLSQKDAAKAIGVKQGTLSELEKTATKSAHTAAAARAYKVNSLWLQSGQGGMLAPESGHSARAAYVAHELDQISDPAQFEQACMMCEALVTLAQAGQLRSLTQVRPEQSPPGPASSLGRDSLKPSSSGAAP